MSTVNVVTEPSIYLLGRQTVDEAELARFLADEDASHWSTDTEVGAEKLVETAGRCCYLSFAKPRPGGNAAYLQHILEVGHGSVTEHAVFNFIITGVSRSLTHELVRHRAGFGYSQLSQRFVDEGGTEGRPLDVVMPPLIREIRDRYEPAVCRAADYAEYLEGLAIVDEWLNAVRVAADAYRKLDLMLGEYLAWTRPGSEGTARRKAAREAARSVLPNATETKIFITGNVRALRHFLAMRGAAGADAEIRRVACRMAMILKDAAPNLFPDVAVADGPGGPTVMLDYPKI